MIGSESFRKRGIYGLYYHTTDVKKGSFIGRLNRTSGVVVIRLGDGGLSRWMGFDRSDSLDLR
jgi:hypothetical protein